MADESTQGTDATAAAESSQAALEDAVDEIMQAVTASILEHKIDSGLAREFVRQTAERAKERLKIGGGKCET